MDSAVIEVSHSNAGLFVPDLSLFVIEAADQFVDVFKLHPKDVGNVALTIGAISADGLYPYVLCYSAGQCVLATMMHMTGSLKPYRAKAGDPILGRKGALYSKSVRELIDRTHQANPGHAILLVVEGVSDFLAHFNQELLLDDDQTHDLVDRPLLPLEAVSVGLDEGQVIKRLWAYRRLQ